MRRAVCAAILVLGCGAEPAPDPPRASAAQPPPAVFTMYGLPGPWWRAGAAQEDFDREARECRRRSRQARAQPGGLDPSDAAYRAFLECMLGHGWSRGASPQPTSG